MKLKSLKYLLDTKIRSNEMIRGTYGSNNTLTDYLIKVKDTVKNIRKNKSLSEIDNSTDITDESDITDDLSDSTSDFDSKIEDGNEVDYIEFIKNVLRTPGNESLALTKASQMNLKYIVIAILTFAEHNGIENFSTAEALQEAARIGHYDIVDIIILDDANNLFYLEYGKAPREKVTSYIPFVEGQTFIPHTHLPLTNTDILLAITKGAKNNHTAIVDYLQKYYFKTVKLKEKLD